MSNSSSSGGNGSCFDIYKDNYYIGVAVLSVVLSILSCICLLAVIAIIVLFKKYVYFNQKLILYLCITSLLYSCSTIINVTPADVDTNPASKGYCIVMGFVNHLLLWWQILCVAVIMIDIFIRVVFERDTQRYKIPYIIGILAPPIVVSWIPFIKLAYGPAGVFCWIRGKEYESCALFTLGAYLRLVLYYGPFYVLMMGLAVLLIITRCTTHRKKKKWIGGIMRKEIVELQKKIESETRLLIGYPILFMVISILPLIVRIYEAYILEEDIFYYAMYTVLIIAYRLIGAIIALIFVLDPETKQKLKLVEIQAAIRRWRGKEEDAIKEYFFDQSARSDSLSEDDKLSIHYVRL